VCGFVCICVCSTAFSFGLRYFENEGVMFGSACGVILGATLFLGSLSPSRPSPAHPLTHLPSPIHQRRTQPLPHFSLHRFFCLLLLSLLGIAYGLFGLASYHGISLSPPTTSNTHLSTLTLSGELFTEHTLSFHYGNGLYKEKITQVIRIPGRGKGRLGGDEIDYGNAFDVELAISAKSTPYGELSLRFETEIASVSSFWSDNGLEMRRCRHTPFAFIPYNVCPSVTISQLRGANVNGDENSNNIFTVLSSTPMGVTSLASGQLEFFLHRSPIRDDGAGLSEPIINNNNNPFLSLLRLQLSGRESSGEGDGGLRKEALELDYQPIIVRNVAVGDIDGVGGVTDITTHENNYHSTQALFFKPNRDPEKLTHVIDIARQEGDERTLIQACNYHPSTTAATTTLEMFPSSILQKEIVERVGLSGWETTIPSSPDSPSPLVCFDVTNAWGKPVTHRKKN